MKASIEQIQERLQIYKLDGWLFHIWRNVNPVALSALDLSEEDMRSRRCYYFIPATGAPRKLQHNIETHSLEHLPGASAFYSSYTQLREGLANLLAGSKTVAMEYSPNCNIPTVSWVDAGTIELVRSLGVDVVSSGELIQYFEASLDDEQIASHFRATELCRRIAYAAFEYAGERIRSGKAPTEFEVQQYITGEFKKNGLVWEGDPIIGANANGSDPHYSPTATKSATLKPGDVLLIDLWAKESDPGSVYADQTWMGFLGDAVPEKVRKIWELVRDARRAGYALVHARLEAGQRVSGGEVDDATRKVIVDAGYGEYFFHRTGHSITGTDHGTGANIDNLETKDDRPLIPRTCFSIEPGIYLPEFGVRSENNVLIDPDGHPILAEGTDQEDLILVNV